MKKKSTQKVVKNKAAGATPAAAAGRLKADKRVKKVKQADLSTSIRLPKLVIAKLKKMAAKKGGIGYQTLIKIWISENIAADAA